MANLDNNTQKEPIFEFKTLLTKEEYVKIMTKNEAIRRDLQTNYYFDTTRFSLKASDAILRVKRTPVKLTIILERKKGYVFQRIEEEISEEEFQAMKDEQTIFNINVKNELVDLIKDQKIVNFMDFSTYRIYVPYKNTKFAVDKCEYCGTIDYELEFQTKNRDTGKQLFVQIIKDYEIEYKKSTVKLKRAYIALKNQM